MRNVHTCAFINTTLEMYVTLVIYAHRQEPFLHVLFFFIFFLLLLFALRDSSANRKSHGAKDGKQDEAEQHIFMLATYTYVHMCICVLCVCVCVLLARRIIALIQFTDKFYLNSFHCCCCCFLSLPAPAHSSCLSFSVQSLQHIASSERQPAIAITLCHSS